MYVIYADKWQTCLKSFPFSFTWLIGKCVLYFVCVCFFFNNCCLPELFYFYSLKLIIYINAHRSGCVLYSPLWIFSKNMNCASTTVPNSIGKWFTKQSFMNIGIHRNYDGSKLMMKNRTRALFCDGMKEKNDLRYDTSQIERTRKTYPFAEADTASIISSTPTLKIKMKLNENPTSSAPTVASARAKVEKNSLRRMLNLRVHMWERERERFVFKYRHTESCLDWVEETIKPWFWWHNENIYGDIHQYIRQTGRQTMCASPLLCVTLTRSPANICLSLVFAYHSLSLDIHVSFFQSSLCDLIRQIYRCVEHTFSKRLLFASFISFDSGQHCHIEHAYDAFERKTREWEENVYHSHDEFAWDENG